jgi:hypothetical protein
MFEAAEGKSAGTPEGSDQSLRASVADLELRIEELAAAIDQSRKLTRLGNVSTMLGLALLAALILTLLGFSPVAMVAGIAFAIGGLVLSGSSKRSTEELMNSLRQAEMQRHAAIDELFNASAAEGDRVSGPHAL